MFGKDLSNILIEEQTPNKFNRIKKRYISQLELNFKKKQFQIHIRDIKKVEKMKKVKLINISTFGKSGISLIFVK